MYNPKGQLASITHVHAGATIDAFGYSYDPLGRVATFSTTSDGTATYQYDKASQLTSATYAGGTGTTPPNESFVYDANGNRKSSTTGGVTTTYTPGTGNLLASDGTFNFTYDGEGNLVQKIRISGALAADYKTVQAWDNRNRLTDVFQYNNSGTLTKHEHLVYDPFDRLIARQIDNTGNGTYDQVERYVYDGADIVLQFDANNNLTYRYLNGVSPSGADQVYAEENAAGSVAWDLVDALGSVRDVASATGAVQYHAVYSAFGEVTFQSSTTVHRLQGYAGGLTDPVTGDLHFGARNLNAVDAVWTSQDPLGFGAGDANLTRYVGNDPLDWVDPSGTAKRKGVGHHYAILEKIVELHEKGLIDDEAFELAAGYFSGQTDPRHSRGTCGKYPHSDYSEKIDEILDEEVIGKKRRKPLNADQMKKLIKDKILESDDPVIEDFLEAVAKRAKKWAEDHPDVPRPKTDKKSLIKQGKDFLSSNKGRIAKLAAKFLVVAGPILDQLVGAIGEAAAKDSPVRREMLAAIEALENDDLSGAHCHVVGTGKLDGMAGELRLRGLDKAAANLEKAWIKLEQAARLEAMRRVFEGAPDEESNDAMASTEEPASQDEPPEEESFVAPFSNEEREAMGFPPRP